MLTNKNNNIFTAENNSYRINCLFPQVMLVTISYVELVHIIVAYISAVIKCIIVYF